MASSWENVKVGDSNMRLYLSRAEDARPAPAVIVVQGQTGVDDFVKFSDMVAARGFVAAAPDLYHRDPPECKDDWPTRRMRLRDATIIQDMNAAIGCLKSHRAVMAGKIGIVGFCMGGRIVHLMAAVNPDIKAGVMITAPIRLARGAKGRHRSSEPRTSSARSWATSAKTIKIPLRRICANSTPR
jgi:carboxymethylenebutenolidase